MPANFAYWAHYWYNLGANVFPCFTEKKTTDLNWSQYQNNPIPREQIQTWIDGGVFDHYGGIGIMAGPLYRGMFKGKYLTIIDLDSEQAITEFCGSHNDLINKLAKEFIVERHADNPNKAHVHFFTDMPVPQKSSNKLGLEVKSTVGNIIYCTPSMHKSGHRYEIIGTREPINLIKAEELISKLSAIFAKHGIPYNERKRGRGKRITSKSNNKMTPERIEKIATLVAPKYVKGQVHPLVWALAGALRRRGVPLSDTEAIVRRMGEIQGDGKRWIEYNVQKVRDTYERDPSKKIRGWPALKEVLG